jgi:hypothetical protein
MNNAASVMESAYNLIENGEPKKAQTLLQTLLPEQEHNPDFWWLMAHATDDPKQGKAALLKVQDLKPDYDGLSTLLEKARSQDAKKTPSLLRRIAPLLLVLVVAVAIFFVLMNQPRPTTTLPDDQATATIQAALVSPTGTSPLPFDAQSAPLNELYAVLASFDVPTDGIQTPTTGTINIPVCSSVGVSAGNVVRDVLVTVANNLAVLPQGIDQVEVSIQNCTDTGEVLRTLSVGYSVLQNYQQGVITLQELQQAVQPVR